MVPIGAVPNEVATCAVTSLLDLASSCGLGDLLADVGIPPDGLAGRRRVNWEFYADVAECFVQRAGGADEAARLAGDLHLGTGHLDWVLSSRFAAPHLYRQACALAPRAWRNLEVDVTPEGDALRIDARLREGSGGAAFFLVSRGSLAQLPARAGLGVAEVVTLDLGATRASWRVRPPRNPTADPLAGLDDRDTVTRDLGRSLAASDDRAALEGVLTRVAREQGDPSGVRLLAAPRPHALPVVLRGEPLAWLVSGEAGLTAMGPLLPWIALALDRIRAHALSRESRLAAHALHARAGASFVVDDGGRLAWANGPGWAWLAAAREGQAQVSRAARRGCSDATFVVRAMGEPRGHVVVTLSDPEADARDRATAATSAWGLTPTEGLVLADVLRGLGNKEVGMELGITEATVEVHMTRIFRKAGIQGRAALISRVWSTAW